MTDLGWAYTDHHNHSITLKFFKHNLKSQPAPSSRIASSKNVWKWTKKTCFCLLFTAGRHAKAGRLPEGLPRNRLFSVDFVENSCSTWKLVKIHNKQVFLIDKAIIQRVTFLLICRTDYVSWNIKHSVFHFLVAPIK